MKRKTILALSALALCGTMSAQDIYKVETFSGSDLTGTSRFVGMGGAMSALGADLSVMGQNPAGIGLYRRSDVALTGSITNQPNGIEFCNIKKTRPSFDQAGFVYSCKLGEPNWKFVNFGFNYQKRRNLKNSIGLDNVGLGGLSQSLQMMDLAYGSNGWLDLATDNGRNMTTPFACVGYDAQMIAPIRDADGKITGYEPSEAQNYSYSRMQWGGIQQYDFNVSFNLKDQIYGGMTLGVYNVELHSGTFYTENLIERAADGSVAATHPYYMTNDEAITGTGFDLKFGVIFRPLEDSPFRLGFSFSSPVFYDLTQSSYLYMNSPYAYTDANGNRFDHTEADAEIGDYNYRIHTPWKVNVSMGTTVGNFLALGAEYEVSRYTGAQVRYADDGWGYNSFSSSRDKELDAEIDHFLKPVSTFRVGAEFKLAPGVTGRVGYNYVSAPMKKDAYLNLFTASPSYYYSTNTDYVNLGDINRVTAGLGYKGKHFYADLAYQYQRQSGDVYAFHIPQNGSEQNRLEGQKVELNRNNVMLTVGYKF